MESIILRSPEMEIIYNFRSSLTSYFHRMFPRNASWHQREARAQVLSNPIFFELFVPHPRVRRQQTTRGVAYTMLLYDVNGLPGGHDMGWVGREYKRRFDDAFEEEMRSRDRPCPRGPRTVAERLEQQRPSEGAALRLHGGGRGVARTAALASRVGREAVALRVHESGASQPLRLQHVR